MKNKKILLIITGSVAAYKSMDLVRLLKKKSFDVTCILTKSACEFITPLLASSLSQTKTYTDLFHSDDELEMGHINLSRQADLILVAPATADFIAKIAGGYADDLASSTILASNKKVLIAPAMNEKMWQNKQTQKNLQKALESGISIIEPETDILACGEFGVGKMTSPEKITQKVEQYFLNKEKLKGKKILITGGATFEPIDPVRFIGNRSSGKQAIALAKVFCEMGAEVTLVAANIREIIALPKEKIISVKTADEMFDVVRSVILRTKSEGSLKSKKGSRDPSPAAQDDKLFDVFIGCAAVSDYKVKTTSKEKIKKTSNEKLQIELVKNVDILEFVGNSKQRPKLVIGFAAESSNIKNYAKEKLTKKNCDLIVANDIEGGDIFGSDETKAFFVKKTKIVELGKLSKEKLAIALADEIASL